MKILVIGAVSLRLTFRERGNLFYMVALPLLLVFLLGMLFGEREQRLGVTGGDGSLAGQLVRELRVGGGVAVERVAGQEALRLAVSRGRVRAGLVIPDGYEQRVRARQPVEVTFLSKRDDPASAGLEIQVRSAVAREAARLGAASGDGGPVASPPRAEVRIVGREPDPGGLGGFAVSAPSLLVMFVFFMSLVASLGMVAGLSAGVPRRMYATPTSAAAIAGGEAAGRILVALAQGVIIIAGSTLLFGMDWGDPLGAAALLTALVLVGGGAAMLLGSLFRAPEVVFGLAMILGIGLPTVGGTFVPRLEQMGEPLRTIAHLTPHAWGYKGFATLVGRGGGFADILLPLGVLTIFATVLMAAGVWRFHRRLLA
ncbi:ABC transporter permease [Nonomuraea sp. LPB2021202275-12-8]|uniref:ABC transporter permease n=1 Tax=Nonomuraea sp. LPB2021202275-12-8 TaxID=3120159 RepID=UPI00300CE7CC